MSSHITYYHWIDYGTNFFPYDLIGDRMDSAQVGLLSAFGGNEIAIA
jgi:hypothetical protein